MELQVYWMQGFRCKTVGIFRFVTDVSGKMICKSIRSSENIEITVEHSLSLGSPYSVVRYSRAAQEFILDNLNGAIVTG